MSKLTRRAKNNKTTTANNQQKSNASKNPHTDQRLENEVNGIFKGFSIRPWAAMRNNGLREGGLRQVGTTKNLEENLEQDY